ncbi:MAG: DPP IV N-terminal domain-containing protein [Bacteroidota bacterium]
MKKNLFVALLLISASILAQNSKKDITLEDIWKNNTFKAETVSGIESMKDGLHYTTYADGNILKYEYKTGKVVDTILSEKTLKDKISIGDYRFNADESRIIIKTDVESIYRRSYKAIYYIYDRKTKSLTPVSDKGKQQYATLSPTGNKVAFARDNNLFIKDLVNGTETAITKDGKLNEIINGSCDWVYEEEFEFAPAFFWNADGNGLAYYRFDESKVLQFQIAKYGKLYPEEYIYKYPKAGEANSLVDIYVYDMISSTATKVDLGKETDIYVPRIKWTQDANTLCVYRMNRHQNKLELLLADAKTGTTKTMLTETNKCYIEINDNIVFLKDKQHFIWSSDMEGYYQLYLYKMDGKLENKITTAKVDVSDFYGVDEVNKTVYFQAAEPTPMERHIFSVKLDGKDKKSLTSSKGTDRANFSSNFKYFINFHSDANTPEKITLHTNDGKEIRILEDNAKLTSKLKDYNLTSKEFFAFKTNTGVDLNGWMIKPKNFNASNKYPVFMTFYGGPGANTVNDSWEGKNYFWYQLLAESGYVIVSVDNRGTGYRGEEFKKCTYLNLGKYECEDQIEVAKYLKNLPYVDGKRIGVQGWSYGGYMASLCMTKGADYFKAGIAVAPVTNWRNYDNIYTERYMQTPAENQRGYDENSPTTFVDLLKGKFLLIHGTADDNVHFQNSMEFVTALVKAGKQFDTFFYPNKNHGISGGNTRLHLYTMMTDYILKNL